MNIVLLLELFLGAFLGLAVHFLKWQSMYQAATKKPLTWQDFYLTHGAETLTMAIFSLVMIAGLPEISIVLNQFVAKTWNLNLPELHRDFFWSFCVGYMSDSVAGWLGSKVGGDRFRSLAGDVPPQQ